MSDFEAAFREVIGLENGYVFDPVDLGGETKWGISKRAYPGLNIKALTLEDAKQIYWKDFWNRLLLAQITDDDIATEIFEQAVNFGQTRAVLHAQQAIGMIDDPIITDSQMGPQTIGAINRLGQRRKEPFLKVLNGLQFERYRQIVESNPTQKRFFVGWLRRVNVMAAIYCLVAFLPGCSNTLSKPPPTLTDILAQPAVIEHPLSDLDALLFSDAIFKIYAGRSTKAQFTDIAGASTLAAVSTAAMAAASANASAITVSAIISAGTFLAQVLGIVDPATRANALTEGAALIREAQSEFVQCLIRTRRQSIPQKVITECGANLYSKTQASISATERIMVGMLPRVADFQKLMPTQPGQITTTVPGQADH